MAEWVRDGHRVSLEVYNDGISVAILCPGEEMCQSKVRCGICHGEGKYVNGPFIRESESYPMVTCEACGGSGHAREFARDLCHLSHWADCTSALEYHDGNARIDGVTFPAEIRWRYDTADEGPEWRYAHVTYVDEV